MPILASWQMSLELALEEVVAVDPSSSTYRCQPIRVFPALSAAGSASVLVGRSAGHPLTIPVVGPTPATRRLLFPVQPTSLLSPPPPCGPTANSATLSPAAAIFPTDRTAGRSLSGTSLLPCLPQRSTTGSQVARRELVVGRAATPVSLGSKHLLARGRKESRWPRLFWLPWRSPEPFPRSRVGHKPQWKRNAVESR